MRFHSFLQIGEYPLFPAWLCQRLGNTSSRPRKRAASNRTLSSVQRRGGLTNERSEDTGGFDCEAGFFSSCRSKFSSNNFLDSNSDNCRRTVAILFCIMIALGSFASMTTNMPDLMTICEWHYSFWITRARTDSRGGDMTKQEERRLSNSWSLRNKMAPIKFAIGLHPQVRYAHFSWVLAGGFPRNNLKINGKRRCAQKFVFDTAFGGAPRAGLEPAT